MTSQDKLFLARIIEATDHIWILAEDWPSLLKIAHELNIKTAALTQVILDLSLEQIRVQRLQRFNLMFQDGLADFPYQHRLFTYKNGLIQTNQPYKGDALKEFLIKLNVLPSKIIFIDDMRQQLQSVEKICAEMQILFVGFHYTGGEKNGCFDEISASFQLTTLVEQHRWP